jgi:hypothetical protein
MSKEEIIHYITLLLRHQKGIVSTLEKILEGLKRGEQDAVTETK